MTIQNQIDVKRLSWSVWDVIQINHNTVIQINHNTDGILENGEIFDIIIS